MAVATTLSKEDKENIKEQIDKNLNPNQIINSIKAKYTRGISYARLEEIAKGYGKQWSKENKLWIDSGDSNNSDKSGEEKEEDKIVEQLCMVDFDYKDLPKEKKHETLNTDKNSTCMNSMKTISGDDKNTGNALENKEEKSKEVMKDNLQGGNQMGNNGGNTEQGNKNDKENNGYFGSTEDNVKLILHKMYGLERDITYIKDTIIKFKKEKEQNKKDEFKDQMESLKHADEFINIYTSKNKKKSVNINVALAEKIKKLVVEEYQMDNNESEIINTALLMALLKSRVK